MSLGVTSNVNALSILKEFYKDKVEILLLRNSPMLKAVNKERVTGKYVVVPMIINGNGAVTSDYTQVTTQAANSFTSRSMQVTPGRLFSSFVLDPAEYLSTIDDRGAFVRMFSLQAMLAMDGLRKTLASCFYGAGYLDLGLVRAVDSSYLYVDVDTSTAMAISIGSQILFAATNTSAYRGGTVATGPAVSVASIQTVQSGATAGKVRVTFSSTYPTSVAVSDVVMLKGGRDASGNPNAPVGMAGWLPITASRTGATWTTYIATSFFGVDRSIAPDQLAGQYVKQQTGETNTDTILRLLESVRRGGGVADLIVVNDKRYQKLSQEATANRTFMNVINNADGNTQKPNAIKQGIEKFGFSFSTSVINMLIDDPNCAYNTAYIFDMEAVKMYSISNTSPITEPMQSDNQPGGPQAGDTVPMSKTYQFLQDDMFTTSPMPLQSGMGQRVDFQALVAFCVENPAHCGVAEFID